MNPYILIKKFTLLALIFLFVQIAYSQDMGDFNDANFNDVSYTNSENLSYAQTSVTAPPRKWFFGGNLSFSFWNSGTNLLLSPKAYYQFSPMFMLGFGLTYIYSDGQYRQYYNDLTSELFNFHSNSIGGSFLIIFRPIDFLQLSAEYERLHTAFQGGPDYSELYWDTGLFLGVSYVAGNFAFGLRYNVLYNSSTSPYASALTPMVSFYF